MQDGFGNAVAQQSCVRFPLVRYTARDEMKMHTSEGVAN